MAFVVGKDPRDENRRVVASTKNNLAKPPASLVFGLEEAESAAVRVNWLGESEVTAKDLLATVQDQEHADARSEAVEFLKCVLDSGPVPAGQVKEEAEDAGISESTLKRAKKVLGVNAYRENEAGERRGTGRWMWKLPVLELDEDVQWDHASVQGGQYALKENVDLLEQDAGIRTQEFPIDKANVQGDQGLRSRRSSVQGGQGSNLAKGGLLEQCSHGYPSGKDCYLCDPNHPAWLKEGPDV